MPLTALITGANSGIGFHTLKRLYTLGHFDRIIGTGRDPEKCNKVLEQLSDIVPHGNTETTVEFYTCDLTSFKGIEKFVTEDLKTVDKIDVLINNAGIMDAPVSFSAHNIEVHFATNHVGPFHLTRLLLNKLSHEARIINISSGMYKKCHSVPTLETVSVQNNKKPTGSPRFFYMQSKLANCLFTVGLKSYLETHGRGGITVVAVRPGFVRGTELGRHHSKLLRTLSIPVIFLFSKNLDKGTNGIIFCATAPHGDVQSGRLYYDKEVEEYTSVVTPENATSLWELTEKLLTN